MLSTAGAHIAERVYSTLPNKGYKAITVDIIILKRVQFSDGISIEIPYYPGYNAMALFPIQGHPWPYNEYKAMAL